MGESRTLGCGQGRVSNINDVTYGQDRVFTVNNMLSVVRVECSVFMTYM